MNVKTFVCLRLFSVGKIVAYSSADEKALWGQFGPTLSEKGRLCKMVEYLPCISRPVFNLFSESSFNLKTQIRIRLRIQKIQPDSGSVPNSGAQ